LHITLLSCSSVLHRFDWFVSFMIVRQAYKWYRCCCEK